ncbi:MAG: CreA family protein [Pseudomonadota bacterium]
MKPAHLLTAFALAATLSACGGPSDKKVGGFSNDLLGNEIAIEALRDPALPNVVCHVAYFNRSFLDRVRQGNWFENPSNSAVSCQRTGPIDLAGVSLSDSGEEIFSQKQSLLFKRMALRRVVDTKNHTILYIAHSRELIEGSAKIAMSSVALTDQEAAEAQKKTR